MRNIKCQQLKDEIKLVEQYFEDALERKNQVIQRLLGDLDENEEQYSTMLHTHIENIETMIGMFTARNIHQNNRKSQDVKFVCQVFMLVV